MFTLCDPVVNTLAKKLNEVTYMTNNMNQNQRKAIEKALVQMKAARVNLLLVVILTAINIIMYASGSDNMFLFSSTIPYSIAVAGMLTETV